jgi:hypothetical protein
MKPGLLDNVAEGRWSNEIAEAAAKRRAMPGALFVRSLVEHLDICREGIGSGCASAAVRY